MGTFDGQTPDRLPQLFQEFVIPVYPNLGPLINGKYPAHVHSVPEWNRPAQWIVALPMLPKYGHQALELDRWSSSKGIHFDNEAMHMIKESCEAKLFRWNKKYSSYTKNELQQMCDEVMVCMFQFVCTISDQCHRA